MADYQIYNDKITQLALTVANATSGLAVPTPSGTAFTATSSKPASLAASVGGSGGNLLTLTPLVQNSTGITVTVSSPGMVTATLVVDIVADPNLLAVEIATASVYGTVAQNVPAAPGP